MKRVTNPVMEINFGISNMDLMMRSQGLVVVQLKEKEVNLSENFA